MKSLFHTLQLICCGVTFATTLWSQTDSVWFRPDCYWVYDALSQGGPGKTFLQYHGLDNKGGIECARLKYYGYHQPYYQVPPLIEYWPDQYVYARNDSVFLWHSETWVLIYDFTLSEGDTLRLPLGEEYSYAIIEETGYDTILNIPLRFQKWRKKHFEDSMYDYHITVFDRIGGEFILEDAFNLGSPTYEAYYFLECYQDDVYDALDCPELPASDYVHFPVTSASWSEEEGVWCSTLGYRFLQEEGLPFDTLIPGVGVGKKLYHQLTYGIQDACPDPSSRNFNEPPQLIGMLDQVYSTRKVYFTRFEIDYYNAFPLCIAPDEDVFPIHQRVLLYDFDLTLGEVLNWKSEPNEVVYIDSVQFSDQTWRKRYYFGFPPEDIWIEGMGSIRGLLSPYYNYEIADVNCGTLHCWTNEQLLYHTVEEWRCDSVLSAVRDIYQEKSLTRLAPNPARSYISFFSLDEQQQNDVECIIYDDMGRLVFQKKMQGISHIDIRHLRPALYFYTLADISRKSIVTGRFIKQ